MVDRNYTIKDVILKIIELYKYLLKKWKLIIIFSALSASLGLLISILLKPTYDAQLSFVIEEGANSMLGSYSGLASQFGINIGGSESSLFSSDNMIEVLKSRRMIEKTLLSEGFFNGKKQMLINRYIEFNKYDKAWANDDELKEIKFINSDRTQYSLKQDSIIYAFYYKIWKLNLNVYKIDKQLGIIVVQFTSTDELFAKSFVENLMKSVSEFYIETKTRKSKTAIQSIQNRADSVKNELFKAESILAKFKDSNIKLIKAEGYLTEARLNREVYILNLMYGELIKNLEISKMSLLQSTPLIQVIDYPILPLWKEKFGKKKGILIFGFIGGFLICGFLIGKKVYTEIMNKE